MGLISNIFSSNIEPEPLGELGPLKSYIREINPDLDIKISSMYPYEAVSEICKSYGINKPRDDEVIGISVHLILDKIRTIVEGNTNG